MTFSSSSAASAAGIGGLTRQGKAGLRATDDRGARGTSIGVMTQAAFDRRGRWTRAMWPYSATDLPMAMFAALSEHPVNAVRQVGPRRTFCSFGLSR